MLHRGSKIGEGILQDGDQFTELLVAEQQLCHWVAKKQTNKQTKNELQEHRL